MSRIFSLVLGFALGVLVTSWGYDRQAEDRVKQTAEKARTCLGYLVITLDGRTTECRLLMPRFDMVLPYQGDPLRLRRKEIKRAVGG